MVFLTIDGTVVVTTMGLGRSTYEQRDNLVNSCPPSLLNVFGFTALGENTSFRWYGLAME
ncbi:hypothetical protein Hanom_Chr13g01206511 [Helianthus anomalus]